MSRLTIRQKVTLFYALVMILLAILVMSVFYVTMDLQISYVSHTSLERAVKDSFDYIEAPGEWLEISNQFDLYVNDNTLLVYGSEGSKIIGSLPAGFPDQLPLRSDIHQSISTRDETWQVYDLLMQYPNGTEVWVRGIHSMSSSMAALQNVLRTMLIIMPVLIILSLVLGNFVTRRAFAPINKIRQTAENIRRDNDLARRIGLQGRRHDEVTLLAQTFDQMFEKLEIAFKKEKQFTSDVSHELRTPIAAIISQTEYGLSGDLSTKEYKACLESVLVQSRHMSNLVAQLLELSRTSDALNNLHKEPIRLAELCELVADELTEKAQEKSIRIIQKLDSDIVLPLDQTQIMRVVINLVTNAIYYGRPGGFIMIDLHRENDLAKLVISDDGIGIPSEHLDHIFNRFYQVDKARTRKEHSNSGLGLTMVKQIVEAHGGKISVQSTSGVGSTFIISLPAEQQTG